MGDYEWIGLALVVMFVFIIAAVVERTRLPQSLKRLVYVALALRVVGALLRHGVLYNAYGGVGDAVGYFHQGVAYADQFWQLDFSAFWDSSQWRGGKWWGTQFMYYPSGIVLGLIGPTKRGEFVVFSLLAFLGLIGFAVAFRREFSHVPVTRYAAWIWLFPSLWFWPSSVGKDAVIVMGLGIAIAGYIGDGQRIRWWLLLLGLFFVFAVRPQVAAVTVVSLAIGQWLGGVEKWRPAKIVQAVGTVSVAAATVYMASTYLGIESLDVEGVEEYIATNTGRGSYGGSGIEKFEPGLHNAPMASINILFRPFPWETTSFTQVVSSLEIWGLWVAAWFWRRRIIWSLMNWRESRLVRVAVPFILGYSALLGLLISNMGIIARQRIFLFPFVFILFAAAPRVKVRPKSLRRKPPEQQTTARSGRTAPLSRNSTGIQARRASECV